MSLVQLSWKTSWSHPSCVVIHVCDVLLCSFVFVEHCSVECVTISSRYLKLGIVFRRISRLRLSPLFHCLVAIKS